MFIVAVEFSIHPEHVPAFRQAIMQQAHNSLTREEGCQQFDVCFDPADDTRCFLYEKYDDAAAFEVHKSTEHFANFSETVTSFVKDKTLNTWEQATP